DEIHLWIARPARVDASRFRAWLSPEEAARCARFRFEEHRHEYLVTRGLVRTALSAYRDVEPAAWVFRSNEYGRPEITPPCGLSFNLSTSLALVVCAVAEDRVLGVDVEPLARAKEILEVRDTVFTAKERAGLTPDRAVSFWTLKEAYMKARGMGMSL